MISINATTQPATIPPTSLPPSPFCSCLASLGGIVTITSILELVMKFIPPVELALAEKLTLPVELALVIELVVAPGTDTITLVVVTELVMCVGFEVIILAVVVEKIELAVESKLVIISAVKLVSMTLLAPTAHEYCVVIHFVHTYLDS